MSQYHSFQSRGKRTTTVEQVWKNKVLVVAIAENFCEGVGMSLANQWQPAMLTSLRLYCSHVGAQIRIILFTCRVLLWAVTRSFTWMTSFNLCYHSEWGTLIILIWSMRKLKPKATQGVHVRAGIPAQSLNHYILLLLRDMMKWPQRLGHSLLRTSSSWMWRIKYNLNLRLDSWTQQKFHL